MLKIVKKAAALKTRRNFGRGDKKRDADQTTPDDVIRFDNILYGDDKKLKKWQLLDVYRPKNLDNENTLIELIENRSFIEIKDITKINPLFSNLWIQYP